MSYLKNLFVTGMCVLSISWFIPATAATSTNLQPLSQGGVATSSTAVKPTDSTTITRTSVGGNAPAALSNTIVLGRGITQVNVAGYTYRPRTGDQVIQTPIKQCPPNTSPSVSLSSPSAYPSGGPGGGPPPPVIGYGLTIDLEVGSQDPFNPKYNNGIMVSPSGFYQIWIGAFGYNHSSDVSCPGAPSGMCIGSYTGGMVDWTIYCVPAPLNIPRTPPPGG